MKELQTTRLLRRWHDGDRSALHDLLQRDLPWIQGRVSRRLGPGLRRKAETQDVVQDAMIEVLTYCPRFTVASRDMFRGLLAQIVENVLRDQHHFFNARRRDMSREAPMPADSVLDLGPAASPTQPSAAAEQHEEEGWLRLGLELVAAEDREVILLRQWDGLPFEAIGERLGIGHNAARMRFQRALGRLGDVLEDLRRGRWQPPDSEPPAE